jgi:hypothetical protein
VQQLQPQAGQVEPKELLHELFLICSLISLPLESCPSDALDNA